MAIGKIIKGSHFGAAIKYLIGEGHEPRESDKLSATPDEWIAPGYEKDKRARILQTNLSGANQKEWAHEFEAMESLRAGRKIKDQMRHITFSLKPGETLTTAQWQETAENLLDKMGYKDAPYLVVQHRDRNHDHIHIITSRITYGGKAVPDSFEKDRLRTFAREIEVRHDLTRTPQRAEKKTMTKGETELVKRINEPTLREQIQSQIEEATALKRGAVEFAEELRRGSVFVKPNIQKSGRVVGISFAKADSEGKVWAFKGSDLGSGYKWSEVAKKVDYRPERDADGLREAKKEAESAMRGELKQPITSPTAKSSAAMITAEKPQQQKTALKNLQPTVRGLSTRIEREAAIADLIAQHNDTAKNLTGADLSYGEQKRLAKSYRESADRLPVEKQFARLEKIQIKFSEPLPQPRTMLEASILTLDNLTADERKEILRQQIQNIRDLMQRETQPKILEQSRQQQTPGIAKSPQDKQEQIKNISSKQISEAQERRFISASLNGEQIEQAVEQMLAADAVLKEMKQSLTEQGIRLEPRAERMLSATIDNFAQQSPTAAEQRSVQAIAQERGENAGPKNRLEAVSYLLKNAEESERDEIAKHLGDAAHDRAEKQQLEKSLGEKQRTQTQKQEKSSNDPHDYKLR